MCGICGFIGPAEGVPNRERALQGMKDRIIHRGPDDEGSYLDEAAALGFRRLSIIDLSHGHQPMTNEDGSVVVTFNGEIYNYREVRDGLVARGHRFATGADTEVLVHGWEEYGEGLLERLRGMFAFIIWDARTQTAFGARDFFGIKPLYYTLRGSAPASVAVEGEAEAASPGSASDSPPEAAPRDSASDSPPQAAPSGDTPAAEAAPRGATLIYASEIKAILAYPGVEPRLNLEALEQYLSFQYSALPETFFKGIFKLGPGECFTFREGELSVRRYFDPLPAAQAATGIEGPDPFDSMVERIKRVMEDSVRAHMIADVEVGSLLSSGIDSSYITALYPNERTYTVGFETADGVRYNEISYAEQAAAEMGKANTSRVISPEEYWDAIPRIMYHMDEPLADPSAVALFFLDELVARDVKVVLSGEGADEFFGGYPIYHEPLSLTGFQRLPRSLRRALAAIARAIPVRFKGKSFLERASKSVEERYISNAYLFSVAEREALLRSPTHAAAPETLTRPSYAKVAYADDTSKMQYIDYNFWLPGDILLKADKMSMAHSLESRVPFLDVEVFALANSLPLEYRVNSETTKVALRAAALDVLPERIASRPKLGFPVPMRVWLAEERWYARVRAAFEGEVARRFFNVEPLVGLLDAHRLGKADNSRKIWNVYVFIVWYEVFFGGGYEGAAGAAEDVETGAVGGAAEDVETGAVGGAAEDVEAGAVPPFGHEAPAEREVSHGEPAHDSTR